LLHYSLKPFAVIALATVKAKRLFVKVFEKMKWLDSYIRAFDASLEKRPKVFDSVSVNLSINVLLSVIDNAVNVFLSKLIVGAQRVCIDIRSGFDVLSNLAVKVLPL